MKIIKNDINTICGPEIISDLNGNIIYLNEAAKRELKITKTDNVSKIIDIDMLKKLSMFEYNVEVATTSNKKYREAILKANGTGANKTVQITFSSGYDKNEEDIEKERQMIALSKVENITTEINSLEMSKMIIDELSQNEETKHIVVNNYSTNDTYKCNPRAVQIYSCCAIGLANEISPTRPVSFSIKRVLNCLQIEVKVAVNTLKNAYGIQEVVSMLPFASLKLSIIDELAESEKNSYEVFVKGRSFVFRLIIANEKPIMKLYAPTFAISMLPSIVTAFAPRPKIKEKYERE